jgi:glucose uptake protein GlcU
MPHVRPLPGGHAVQQRTAATLVTLILSLCVLVLLAAPLTWRKIVLVGAVLAGFVLLFPVPAVRRFYELQLPHSGLATGPRVGSHRGAGHRRP